MTTRFSAHVRAAVLAVLLVVGVATVAFAAGPLVNTAAVPVPTCTKPTSNVTAQKEVDYAECQQRRTEALLTNLHPAPTVTETVTVTASPTASPSTATSSPSPSPTATAAPAPAPTASTCTKPDATNTGATGTLSTYGGPSVITTNGTVVDGKTISGDIRIQANNVTIRNSKVAGGIYVDAGSTGTKVSRNTAQRVSISSAQTVLVEFNDLGFSSQDATHVTSDNGSMVSDVTIQNNYIHDPRPGAGEHWDGLQVRGVNGITVYCNYIDFGPNVDQNTWNSPVFLEGGANGGITGAVVDSNWLLGGAFGFMYGPDNDGKTRLINNHFGGTYVWQSANDNSAGYAPDGLPPVQSGNDLRGVAFTPCP